MSLAIWKARKPRQSFSIRIFMIRGRASFGGAIAQAVPGWTAFLTTTPISSVDFWTCTSQASAFTARLQSDPDAVPALVSALDFRLAQIKQLLIAGDPTSPDTRALLRQVNARFLPNKILLLADGGTGQRQLAVWLPFIAGAQ